MPVSDVDMVLDPINQVSKLQLLLDSPTPGSLVFLSDSPGQNRSGEPQGRENCQTKIESPGDRQILHGRFFGTFAGGPRPENSRRSQRDKGGLEAALIAIGAFLSDYVDVIERTIATQHCQGMAEWVFPSPSLTRTNLNA